MSDRVRDVLRHNTKAIALAAAIAGGIFVPQAAALAGLIPYLIIGMLFFAFLTVPPQRRLPDRSILLVLIANLAIAGGVYAVLRPIDRELALTGFFTAVSPTATAAPVVIGLLGGAVEYAAAAVLVTNISVAILLPLFQVWHSGTYDVAAAAMLGATVAIVLGPLAASQLLQQRAPVTASWLRSHVKIAFWAWSVVLFLAVASASHFIRASADISLAKIAPLAILSLLICIANFGIGYLTGLPKYGREASQSLGQKNTMLTVWFSLAYCSPLIALGPTFYIIFHNIYNSYQLLKHSKDSFTATDLSEG